MLGGLQFTLQHRASVQYRCIFNVYEQAEAHEFGFCSKVQYSKDLRNTGGGANRGRVSIVKIYYYWRLAYITTTWYNWRLAYEYAVCQQSNVRTKNHLYPENWNYSDSRKIPGGQVFTGR